MNNCLVTKLKSSVNNDNLPYFDSINLKITHDSSATERHFFINVSEGKSVDIDVVGNGVIAPSKAELNPGVTHMVVEHSDNQIGIYCKVYTDHDYIVRIKKKHNLSLFGYAQTYDLVYINNINEFEGLSFMLGMGLYPTLEESELDCSLLSSLEWLDVRNAGTVKVNIETLNLSNLTSIVGNGLMCGDLEMMVQNAYNKNPLQASGHVQFANIKSGALWAEIYFGTYQMTNGTLHWESPSKMYYSTTSTDTIYEKGYSAEDIATWEGQGKTVVVVS